MRVLAHVHTHTHTHTHALVYVGLTPEEAKEKPFIASMGIYVFKKNVLIDLLTEVRVWGYGCVLCVSMYASKFPVCAQRPAVLKKESPRSEPLAEEARDLQPWLSWGKAVAVCPACTHTLLQKPLTAIYLIARLLQNAKAHDFGGEIIPEAAKVRKLVMTQQGAHAVKESKMNVVAYPFYGYWEDIGTVKSFFDENLKLTRHELATLLSFSRVPLHFNSYDMQSSSPRKFTSYISRVKGDCPGFMLGGGQICKMD
eukprot:1138687-Pelagomonas_calceolata.AAC.1